MPAPYMQMPGPTTGVARLTGSAIYTLSQSLHLRWYQFILLGNTGAELAGATRLCPVHLKLPRVLGQTYPLPWYFWLIIFSLLYPMIALLWSGRPIVSQQ